MKKRWMLLVVTVMCLFTLTGCGKDQVTVSGDEFKEILEDEGFNVYHGGFAGLSILSDTEVYSATHDQTQVYYMNTDTTADADKMYHRICNYLERGVKAIARDDEEIIVDEDNDDESGQFECDLAGEAYAKVVWTEDKIIGVIDWTDDAEKEVNAVFKSLN